MTSEAGEHMLQYAFVGDTMVHHTERLSDEQVREKAARIRMTGRADSVVERYDRCPACEVWTTFQGKPRLEIECPAVQALAREVVRDEP